MPAPLCYTPNNPAYLTFDDTSSPDVGVGGIVVKFLAGAALNLGDTVYLSAARTVNKSTTAALHVSRVGVVVGGTSTKMTVTGDANLWGTSASATGELVQVMVTGVTYVICDGTIAAGTPIAPSTTVAGRVRAATTPVVAAGATPVTSSAANGAIITGDGFSRVLGILLDAGTIGLSKLALILPA